MPLSQAKLIKKIPLTHDVFELHYEANEKKEMLAGQFITFILPQIWGRAYSVLELEDRLIKLIIKRWSSEMWWRGGSMFLCDAEIWDSFNYVGPTGHFVLKNSDIPRCFLWTGTGFVPLYNQILSALQRGDNSEILFVFWVRSSNDIFYIENLQNLSEKYENFSYEIYLSKEKNDFTHHWYVTDAIDSELAKNFEEYYICWAPAMIESSEEKLLSLWVNKENVFFEKY